MAATGAPAKAPLWPKGVKIPFIVVSGEFGSGKTLWLLSIDHRSFIIFDFEGSAETYEAGLGMTRVTSTEELIACTAACVRVDMNAAMLRIKADGKWTALDRYLLFIKFVSVIPAGRFRVCACDTASEIEQGLMDYVRSNPSQFNYTPAQFAGSVALFMGAVKTYMKKVFGDIITRFETTGCTVHMRDVFKNGKPTGEREAKGKETLMELASLYLELERAPNTQEPSGKKIKDRVSFFALDGDGELSPQTVLPPRMPRCTPGQIRAYINNPPDFSNLAAGERVTRKSLSDDEKLKIEAQIASDRAAAAVAQSQMAETMAASGARVAQAQGVAAPAAATAPQTDVPAGGGNSPASIAPAGSSAPMMMHPPTAGSGPVPVSDQPSPQRTEEQIVSERQQKLLVEAANLKKGLDLGPEQWDVLLTKLSAPMDPATGKRTARLLSEQSLEHLTNYLQKLVVKREEAAMANSAEEALNRAAASTTPPGTSQTPAAAGALAGNA